MLYIRGLTVHTTQPQWVNTCLAELISDNLTMCFHFLSFLNIKMAQVVEIQTHGKQGPVYTTCSISCLLMTWWRKEPGHQHPWYCISNCGIFYAKFNTRMDNSLTHWGLGDFNEILYEYTSSQSQWLMAEIPPVKLPSEECHYTLLMISQDWFR